MPVIDGNLSKYTLVLDEAGDDANFPIESRVGVMFGILFVSLFGMFSSINGCYSNWLYIFFVYLPSAVSFPGISKKVSFLRIPHLVFFIGKHFGTGGWYSGVGYVWTVLISVLVGVILSTAFCHLLPDAFESLRDPAVQQQYHNIGKWTGMIMCASLVSIAINIFPDKKIIA